MASIHAPVVLWCWVVLWIASHSWLYINGPSEPGRLKDVCVCQWVKEALKKMLKCAILLLCRWIFFCVKVICNTVLYNFIKCLQYATLYNFRYFILVPHSILFLTHILIHGMYVCMYVYCMFQTNINFNSNWQNVVD